MREPQQIDFIDNPISRNTDPATSKIADARHTKTARGTRCWQVLDLISRHPRHTAGELGRIFIDEHPELSVMVAALAPNKRIVDLKAMNLIFIAARRECESSGYLANTWQVSVAGHAVLRDG